MDLTPRHRLEALVIAGGSKFTERPENLAANDEAEVKGRAWLSALTWRFTPSARFSLTQKGFVTGLRFRNHNRDNAVLDSASSSEARLAYRRVGGAQSTADHQLRRRRSAIVGPSSRKPCLERRNRVDDDCRLHAHGHRVLLICPRCPGHWIKVDSHTGPSYRLLGAPKDVERPLVGDGRRRGHADNSSARRHWCVPDSSLISSRLRGYMPAATDCGLKLPITSMWGCRNDCPST